LWKNIWAEVKVGCIIGLVAGVVMSFIALLWQNNYLLGLLIGISLGVAMITATTMGALLPLIFTKIKIDPAISAGPFITTAIDVSGLSIYFGLGSFLFKHFGI
jgi:magnesium transporter